MLDESDRDDTEKGAERTGATAVPRGERRGRLHGALRRARLNEAERSDVVIDLREAEFARLEMLADSLADVFEDIPPGTDLLECTLVPGAPPRLWIDVLAYVAMGRDKRTYRFVKETRYGPKVILESASLDDVADSVTDYVAHRLLERARALDSDTHALPPPAAETPAPAAAPPAVRTRGAGFGTILLALFLGALAGASALFAVAFYVAGAA